MGKRFKVFNVAVIVYVVFVSFLFVGSTYAQTDQANLELKAANTAVNQAFNAVLAAENAGANVSSLLSKLNVATTLLAQGENAYRTGDNTTAVTDAGNILLITQQVTTAAQVANEASSSASQTNLLYVYVIPMIGVGFFILFSFFIWRLFRRHYIKGLLKAKPEVMSQ